jgi:hypothetical protein
MIDALVTGSAGCLLVFADPDRREAGSLPPGGVDHSVKLRFGKDCS